MSLQFSVCRSFKSLVKFTAGFFLGAIVNGVVFLISLSDSSLLMYRITNDPAVLLNSFFSSDSLLVVSCRKLEFRNPTVPTISRSSTAPKT